MSNFFIGHWLANLIVPGDPDKLTITTPAGQWLLSKAPNFTQAKAAIISGGQCAKTYAIEFNGTYSGSRAAAMDAADADLIPICLGASYLTALGVAPTTSLPGSDISFLQVGDHFPRVRAMRSSSSRFSSALCSLTPDPAWLKRSASYRIIFWMRSPIGH